MNSLNLGVRDRRRQTPCRLFSILSGKGGVGKSVIAFNLADCLHRQSSKVLLVDTSLGGGNLHILANVPISYGVAQYADGTLSLAEAVTTIRDGFDLLAASGNADNQSSEQLIQRLRIDGESYDVVIIDHGSGQSDRSTLLAHGSDVNLLVLIPEVTSIADAYGLFKRLSKSRRPHNCRLVINRAQSEEEADYIQSKFMAMAERFLGVKLTYLGSIPEDTAVRGAVASQIAILQKSPDAPASLALNRIAEAMASRSAFEATPQSESFSRTIFKPAAAADRRG